MQSDGLGLLLLIFAHNAKTISNPIEPDPTLRGLGLSLRGWRRRGPGVAVAAPPSSSPAGPSLRVVATARMLCPRRVSGRSTPKTEGRVGRGMPLCLRREGGRGGAKK